MLGQLDVKPTHQEPDYPLEDESDDQEAFGAYSVDQESANEGSGHVKQLLYQFLHQRQIQPAHIDNCVPAKDSLEGAITACDRIDDLG